MGLQVFVFGVVEVVRCYGEFLWCLVFVRCESNNNNNWKVSLGGEYCGRADEGEQGQTIVISGAYLVHHHNIDANIRVGWKIVQLGVLRIGDRSEEVGAGGCWTLKKITIHLEHIKYQLDVVTYKCDKLHSAWEKMERLTWLTDTN